MYEDYFESNYVFNSHSFLMTGFHWSLEESKFEN